MIDETQEQVEYFTYATDLVDEMHELFEKHEALVEEYSRAMEYIGLRNWRQEYVHWVGTGRSVEGKGDSNGDSSD